MSKNKIQISKRVGWSIVIAILLCFAVADGYFLYFSYEKEIKRSEMAVLNELKAVARCAAMEINGDDHESLTKKYGKKDDIDNDNQEKISLYQSMHESLVEIKRINKIETNMYTMFVSDDDQKSNGRTNFLFGVSAEGTFYRHEYTSAPEVLINNYLTGGVVHPYKDEHGYWLSAFEPIHNSNGEVVAVVQVDNIFTSFVEEAQSSILGTIIFSIIVFIVVIIAIIMINKQSLRLNDNINEQKNNYIKLAAYAEKIGKGNYDAKYEISEENDSLGRSLIKMSENLKNNRDKDTSENWLAIGRDKISTILRENTKIDELSYKVLVALIDYIEIVQGAMFIVDQNENTKEIQSNESTLNMVASYAYGRKKYMTSSFKLGEGLIGEAAIEQQTIHRTEIPDNHLTVTSGLIIDKKPSALLIVPLVTEEKLQGVIELAGFKRFTDLQVRFIEELAEILARTLYNLKTTERTEQLLYESQNMTQELQGQQAQLEENAVEMRAKQEEIENTNIKLEDQITEVKNAQNRQHALLENASEIITIYNAKGISKYESPSIKNILGYEAEEFVGKKVDTKLKDLFNYVLKNPKETKTIQLTHKKKNGEEVWIESTGRNMLNDLAIEGIVLNSTDITERRKAEREQIMRGKMQALSENSEDIIIRFDLKGVFQYANPALERFTGFNSEVVNNKSFEKFKFQDTIKTAWKEIIKNVEKEQKLIVSEMEFPTETESKIMLVNAIPEFDENNQLETILVVSHDITERKKQEVVLADTNKKITDSINYAKRIQNAIIPSIEEIQKDIRDTFMFYKPKDVVSGDFPYYYKKGDYLYYAAVDCTGHGVPGAMMSLIGHLLLNDILNDDEILSPAEVLTRLHWGVVKTLKQDDEDNKAADGMDIAMCRINLKNNEIEYSGAQRPLYHVRDGELTQYKGDKYPIGGNQYKGKNSYSNHIVSIEKGDSVFFFSDGLPDQFGGPDQLKYGPKKIRTGIMENINKSPKQIEKYFNKSYHDWMGNTKQIDDVLLIGIKF